MKPPTELRDYKPSLRFPGRIVILGNDLTAWMTAALLIDRFDPLGLRVTVCSADETVGSKAFASTPALNRFLRHLGVDEHDMLRSCGGTYRLATQFSDWAHDGRDFWQPVGVLPVRIAGHELFDAWVTERKAGRLLRPLHSYSVHWTASLGGKSPHSFAATSAFAETGEYGFHCDAVGATAWIRELARQRGVEEVTGGIQRVFPNGRGGIAQVKLESGRAVPGDFFLECRQSAASQDAQESSSKFVSDRQAVVRCAAERQVSPFTRVTGLDAGWMLTLPLAHETEFRYSFSTQLQSDDEAQQTLQTCIGNSGQVKKTDKLLPRFQDISAGVCKTYWNDNVVKLGAAAGRIPALSGESSHWHHAGIELLLELFPNRNIGRATRDEYNRRMESIAAQHMSFAQLHQQLSATRNGRYATAVRNVKVSDGLRQALAIYDQTGAISATDAQAPAAWQHQWLLAGAGRLPARPSVNVATDSPGDTQNSLRALIKHNETLIKDLPLHEELLDWIHTGPFQQQAG